MNGTGQRDRPLNPGTRPPDFGFGDEGTFYKLSQFKNMKRVLMIICRGDLDQTCIDGMRRVKRDWRQYRDREFAVVLISSTPMETLSEIAATEVAPIILVSDERGDTIARYGGRTGENPIAYLIETDGLIAAVWNHWPSSREIFEGIDRGASRRNAA